MPTKHKEKKKEKITIKKEPITIPKQLLPFRFCFVDGKLPMGKKWQEEKNTYKSDDQKLLDRLKKGDSYGVVGGFGELTIVDCDNTKVFDAFSEHHDTLTGGTGNGKHLFYKTPGLQKSQALQELDRENSTPDKIVIQNCGHITSKGRMVVAPGCLHYNAIDGKYVPSGKRYKVINDAEIKTITQQELTKIIKPFMSEIIRAKYEIDCSGIQENGEPTKYKRSIDISLVAEKMSELRKTSPGYRGHNPNHPHSKSRMDLSINTTDNTWVCAPCSQSEGGHGDALYLIALNEGILQCHECKKGGLRGDKFLQVKKIAIEKYSISPDLFPKGKSKGEPVKVIPSKITAKLNEKIIEMTGRIVAEKRKKGMPKTIRWMCKRCDRDCIKKMEITNREPFIFRGKHSLKGIVAKMGEHTYRYPELICEKQQKNKEWTPSWFGIVDEYDDYNILWMTDRLEDQDDFKSSENKIKIILMGTEAPISRTLRVCGKVVVDPFNNDLVVLADEIEEVETNTENLILNEKTKADFDIYFKDKALENPLQIAPDMVGHDVARLSRLLLLHSPIWIKDLNGKKIRGCLREVLFGDTKTYKSLSIKDIIDNYHFGEWCSAETGTRAGLLYFVDTEKATISWGILPLNDRGYIGLESINIMRSEEFSKFREVLEDMRIKVTMSVQGASNVRTRMSVTMNPPKPMNSYLFPCQAITDTYIFRNIPDITRWDIWLPFGLSDIPTDAIVDRGKKERPIPDDIFMKHVYWAWSISQDNIIIEKEAKKIIKAKTKEIMRTYEIDIIPIVHPAARDVITRISVAMAILNHSTTDCITINVREKDVQDAVTFYVHMLNDLNLGYYKNLLLGENYVDDGEMSTIYSEFEIEHYKILDYIKVKPRGSNELAELLGVSSRTIKRKYEALQNFGLIKSTPRKGTTLSQKGLFFVRKQMDVQKTGNSDIRSNGDIYVPKSPLDLRPSVYNTEDTLDSFFTNNNNIDNNTIEIIKEIYNDSIAKIIPLIKDIKRDTVYNNIKEYEAFLSFIKEKENEVVQKALLYKDGLKSNGDTVTKVSPLTGVGQNTKKTDDDAYLPKIIKLMETKPKHVWSINDICWGIGIAGLPERKKINKILIKICSDPKNKTKIKMADKSKLSFILVGD